MYDLADRLVRVEDSAGLTVSYEYDDAGRQHKLSYTVGGETVTQEMTYGEGALADRPSGLTVNNVPIKSYTYDSLNRVTKTTLNTTAPVETNYTYLNHPTTANQTSSVVAGVKVGAGAQYTYAYDQNGNIVAEYKDGELLCSYGYDAKNQLVNYYYPGLVYGEAPYEDEPAQYVYVYDDAGNLYNVFLSAITANAMRAVSTLEYENYAWRDQLTIFNDHTITYDEIGNPLEYRYGEFFTWQNGRQLEYFESMSGYSGKVGGVDFEYDADGYRTRKTGTGEFSGETSYLYSGGSLLRETKTNPTTNATVYDLYFTYDEAGRPFSISSYSETLYYFYDIYGNVKYLYDAYGNLVAEYTYRDPWGGDVELTCHYFEGFWIAELNPFTYKGYYYDADLQMYYCGSRYYDPETCRWINADGQLAGVGGDVLGYNLYAYCFNNPVMLSDPTGNWPDWNQLFKGVLLATVGVLAVAAVVATGGAATPLVAAGYAAVATAGVAAMAIGASEVCESITGTNPVKNAVGEDNYNALTTATVAVLSVSPAVIEAGTAVTGTGSSSNSTKQNVSNASLHQTGTVSPKKISIPNGSYTKLDFQNRIYSYTQYDSLGRQSLRIDFQGKPHAGVIPHIHIYYYPQQGGCEKFVYDLNWNLIGRK